MEFSKHDPKCQRKMAMSLSRFLVCFTLIYLLQTKTQFVSLIILELPNSVSEHLCFLNKKFYQLIKTTVFGNNLGVVSLFVTRRNLQSMHARSR